LQGSFGVPQVTGLLASLLVLPGLYLLLNLVSRGRWVGSGDYWLALTVALVVPSGWLALLVLFLSNSLGCVVYALHTVIYQRKLAKLPFGPLLIVAGLVVFFAQGAIIAAGFTL
jgi:leader peptidase (prepilin peptidase)/N-methyltransferase